MVSHRLKKRDLEIFSEQRKDNQPKEIHIFGSIHNRFKNIVLPIVVESLEITVVSVKEVGSA